LPARFALSWGSAVPDKRLDVAAPEARAPESGNPNRLDRSGRDHAPH
jgi:hypothetical protein